jgi:hypothetical protein
MVIRGVLTAIPPFLQPQRKQQWRQRVPVEFERLALYPSTHRIADELLPVFLPSADARGCIRRTPR